ncbi:VOC family protein [Pantoea agglomerans]|uniref:VOC family protein n=1 Tax=Enterobacter agglomerans TaxID=549 RepID=UPI00320A2D8D
MLNCSHILCKVDNLRDAVALLEQAGFSVQWGGKPEKAHNALVWFEQGPFLEFFELPRAFRWLSYPFGWRFGRAAGERLRHWALAPSGWCDVALEPQQYQPADPLNLDRVSEHLRQHTLAGSRLVKGRRISANGEQVHYRFMALADRHLPFIVSHYHPLQRPAQINHANGARGVACVNFLLPAESHTSLLRLLPTDGWLNALSSDRRQVSSVTLTGWQALPQTSDFIHSLFTVPQEA